MGTPILVSTRWRRVSCRRKTGSN